MSCSNNPNPSRIHVLSRLQVAIFTLPQSRIASHWSIRIHLANTDPGACVVIASKSRLLLYILTWAINVSFCAALGCRGSREGARRCSLSTWLPCMIVKQMQRQIDFDTPLGSRVWATTNNALGTVNITFCPAESNDTGPKENPTSLSTCGLA